MTIPGYVPAIGETDSDKIIRAIRNLFENAALASDVAYDATTWDSNTDVPTKNTVRDKFESLAASLSPYNCGRLTYVSTTAIKFAPYNGDRIKIAGTVYAIPSAGIAGVANTSVFVNGVAAQNLGASTVYLVCAFVNSGTITADFLTTLTHAPDTTAGNIGVEIKNGDNSRSVIGMIKTNGSSQFADSAAQRFVISWFNRRRRELIGAAQSNITSSSTSTIELTSAARAEFLTWNDEAVHGAIAGYMKNDTADGQIYVSVADDAGSQLQVFAILYQLHNAGDYGMIAASGDATMTEGYHYLTARGQVNAGTGNWNYAVNGSLRI